MFGSIKGGVLLGLAILLPPSALAAAAPASSLPVMLDRVESVRAVKRLQYAYGQYLAAGDWQAAAALFAHDGVLAEDGTGERHGPRAIEEGLRTGLGGGRSGLPPQTLHLHMFMAPIVTLAADGMSARGRWHMIGMDGGLGGSATWTGGILENDYVREGGVWRIARQHYRPFLLGDYATGWHSPGPELPMMPYAHDPARIGVPVTAQAGATALHVPARRDIGAAARRLEAEGKVRNLQNAFGYYLDRRMWDDVADLFAGNGVLSVGGAGSYRGAAGVRRWLEITGPAGLRYGELNDHIQTNVIVDVAPDGRQARARGFDLGMIGMNDGRASWSVAAFDNLYVEQGGVWRIARMRLQPMMKTDYALGWGKSWITDPPPPASAAPDAAAEPFPAPWRLTESGWTIAASRRRDTADGAQRALEAAAAYDAIENITSGYGQYLDDSQWTELAGIFAAQGERDSAGGGFIRTPARIAAFSRNRYGPYNPHRSFTSLHIRTQPVIDVAADGGHAQERTRLFQFLITPENAPPARYESGMMMTGMYEDDVVLEDGAWKFKRVDLDHLLYTLDYRHGWTRIPEGTGKLLDPPLAKDAAFDAPGAGDTYPPFPKVGHMWFHYRNPVSGRAPPYLMPKYDLPEP